MATPSALYDPARELSAAVRKLQTLIGILLVGWLIAVLLIVIVAQAVPSRSARPFVWTYAGAVVAAGGLLARRFVDRILIANRLRSMARAKLNASRSGESEEDCDERRANEARRLLSIMHLWLIVRTAVLEAASFFPLVAYFIERSPISLALAALMVGPAFAQFPTTSAIRLWIGRRMRERPVQSLLGV